MDVGPDTLNWNHLHTKNQEAKYCYCGRDRTLKELNVQCEKCLNWFHASCTSTVELDKVVPFIANYQFQCNTCGDGKELFTRTTASWKNAISTAIANGMINNPPRLHFTKDEVVTFLKENWLAVCTGRDQTKTWWATVGTCMSTSPETFIPQPGKAHSASSPFTILDTDVMNIRPAPPGHPSKSVVAESSDTSKTTAKKRSKADESQRDAKKKARTDKGEKGGRGAGAGEKGKGSTEISKAYLEKLKKQGPVDNVTNRDDYRYTLAEEHPCIEETFRERFIEQGVYLSREDRSPFIFLGKDRLTAWTEKGFRLARATHYCNSGSWYYEVEVLEPKKVPSTLQGADRQPDGPHLRVGWAQKYATIEAPVGFDEFGYSYRDKTGDKVHMSFPMHYGEPFAQGDVIGLQIEFPEPHLRTLSDRRWDRTPIVVKGTLYFEEHSKKPEKLNKLTGSRITFFLNGVSQGVAFADIFEGDYYPAVSLYHGGHVAVNFGPDFRCPPAQGTHTPFRPFCERFVDQAVEDAVLDIIEDVDFELEKERAEAH